MCIALLLDSKAAESTLQTLQKLMRTEIQAQTDMGPGQKATESVHRRGAAEWENGRSCSASLQEYQLCTATLPSRKDD